MQQRLCICIPTHKRKDAVLEKLNREISFLKEYAVDVYVFDSSLDEETYAIVSEIQNQGYSNLYYEKDTSIHTSNEKVFRIYQKMAAYEYDYVWIIHDHTVCTRNAIEYLLHVLEQKSDFYLLKMQESNFKTYTFTSLDEFALNGAWTLNSFGTAIVKKESFLQGCDWKYFEEKYLGVKTINYSHIGFYLERVSQINECSLVRVEFSRECFYDFLRYEKPSWYDETLRICLECWGETITKLPSVYRCKDEILQTQDKCFLSKNNLVEFKHDGIYSILTFLKYSKWIKKIIPELYKDAFKIALLPYKVVKKIYSNTLLKPIQNAIKSGKKICIYGAGRHGQECAEYLTKNNVTVDGFLVTKLDGNPKEIKEISVYEAKEYIKKEDVFIIIAILTSGVAEVESYLTSLDIKKSDYISFDNN